MKKLILAILIGGISVSSMWAERVDLSVARQVATVMGEQMNGNTQLRATAEPELAYIATPNKGLSTLRSTDFNGEADYYVFNYPNQQGFVIVSGEDRAHPVLGYNSEGGFSATNLPEHVAAWLHSYQEQIAEAVKQNREAAPAITQEWNWYLKGETVTDQETVLKTALWDQSGVFNSYSKGFPEMQNGEGKPLTGCVATAMGIIMKYHEYPVRTTGKGVTEFRMEKNTEPVAVDYTDDYQWDKMLVSYEEGKYEPDEAEEASRLLWHCGVNINMKYGTDVSLARSVDAGMSLINVFGYSPALRHLLKSQYTWDEWKQLLREEIDASRPVLYAASGHAFVCDGYSTNGYFHVNWGWSGSYNGFYRLSIASIGSYNFNKNAFMLTHIIPQKEGIPAAVYEPYFKGMSISPVGKEKVEVTYMTGYFGLAKEYPCYQAIGAIDRSSGVVKNLLSTKKQLVLEYQLEFEEENEDPQLDAKNQNEEENVGKDVRCSFECNLSDLGENQMGAPVFSLDGEHWTPIRTLDLKDIAVIGFTQKGVVNKFDDDTDTSWPSFIRNGFEENELTRIEFTDKYLKDPKWHQLNTDSVTILCPKDYDFAIHYKLDDYLNWAKHLRIYAGSSEDKLESIDSGINEKGHFMFLVRKENIKDHRLTYTMKILSDTVGVLPYALQVHPFVNGQVLDPMLTEDFMLFTIAEQPTGNEVIVPNEAKVWTSCGKLYMQTAKLCDVRIMNVKGACVKAQTLGVGTSSVSLAPGIYVVEIGKETIKVRIH